MIERRREDWQDLQEAWLDNPQQAANHMVLAWISRQDEKLDSSMGLEEITAGLNEVSDV